MQLAFLQTILFKNSHFFHISTAVVDFSMDRCTPAVCHWQKYRLVFSGSKCVLENQKRKKYNRQKIFLIEYSAKQDVLYIKILNKMQTLKCLSTNRNLLKPKVTLILISIPLRTYSTLRYNLSQTIQFLVCVHTKQYL